MSSDDYLALKARLESDGAFFHPALFRQVTDGVPGLYTDRALPAGECVMRVPKSCTSGFDQTRYPANTSLAVMYIHHAASQLQNHTFDHQYFSLDRLTEQQAFSCYFFDSEQIARCKDMSTTLGKYIAEHNQETAAILTALSAFDPDISDEIYLETILNYRSRAMGQNGFVPGAVLFNHSSERGNQLENTEDALVVTTRQAYQAGEEVFVSYGNIDLLKHATSYNYFDSADQHFIQLGKRLAFPMKAPRDQALANQLSKRFLLSPKPVGMFKGFSIDDPNALFDETQASDTLNQIATLFAQAGVYPSAKAFLQHVLDELSKHNKVSTMAKSTLPDSLHRFYDALDKEARMIEANQAKIRA